MRQIAFLLVAGAMVTGVVAPGTGHADEQAAPIFVTDIPPGYRDWRLISVAHEEGNLNDLRAILGNDVATKAYREGKLPLPDGAIIARVAWGYVPLEESSKAFGHPQSFVAGPPTNVQFMVKDSKNTLRRAAGGSLNLTTANPPPRRYTASAFSATRLSKLAILSSTVTHLDRTTGRKLCTYTNLC